MTKKLASNRLPLATAPILGQTPSPMSLRTFIVLSIVLPLLAACGGIPIISPEQPLQSDAEILAQGLFEQGQYTEAADAYLQLAATQGIPHKARFRLQAADALISAGEQQRARKLLEETSVVNHPPSTRQLKAILNANLDLAEHRPHRALTRLEQDFGEKIPVQQQRRLRLLRASALGQSGNFIEAAMERIALEPLMTDPTEIDENRRLIWDHITQLQPLVLEEAGLPPPDPLGGWMELAVLTHRHSNSLKSLATAIKDWNNRYPGHPANLSIIPTLLDSSRFEITSPEHIALLLPQEGSFARASAAIRDGFVGAWYHGGTLEDEYHPVISIYNATPSTIHSIYQDALEAGAEFIVGPLDKESVTILADYESLDIPTLALNYADTSFSDPSWELPEGFYQFGLSPEGEARQVAEKAWLDGHTRAIVIYPHSPWGERVSSAFNQAWQELDGTVIDTRAFAKGGQGIAAAIADLLNVDASKARALKLKRFLKQDLKYEPRRRSDVDFVFMAAFPKQARQIRPQLMFHHASDLPVYATSHIYPGTSNPREDRDLNGVMFADMPWILKPKDTAAELQKQIKTNWPEAVTTYNRLFALGVDAYQLVPYLRRMRGNRYASFSGVTGRLLLDERNLVQRELQWAKFRGGKAHPVRDAIPGPNGQ